ncbi:MAG: hypothetical protein CVU89_08930 [Firmicutes bacterium HGW-Firmicutes-14]|nr:MAG: hypothetical protein CVU89_08930 [Firmicutes bacterium HGW-Firmicutes-14]
MIHSYFILGKNLYVSYSPGKLNLDTINKERLEKVEEQKPLPDIINSGLKILFIGYNPGLRSAEKGHHYAGRSNRFWDSQ